MTFGRAPSDGGCILRIHGKIDRRCALQLNHLARMLARRESIVVDASDVFADATFVRFLLQMRHTVTKALGSRSVRVVGANPELQRTLEFTGLIAAFGINPTLFKARRLMIDI